MDLAVSGSLAFNVMALALAAPTREKVAKPKFLAVAISVFLAAASKFDEVASAAQLVATYKK